MNEILLQTIVEKLESLEIALLKKNNTSNDEALQKQALQNFKSLQAEIQMFISQLNNHNEKFNVFSKEMNLLRLNVGNLEPGNVKHIHLFHKLVWLTVSLFIISLLLAYGWINCSNEKKSFEANDMKYRFWKANANANLLKIVFYPDSLYNLDKDHFIQQVVRSEQQIAEQEKCMGLLVKKKRALIFLNDNLEYIHAIFLSSA